MHEYFSIWTVTDKTIVFHSDSRLLLSLCARRYCAYSKCNLNCKRSKVLRSKTYAFPLNETSVTIYCLTCLQLCTMRAETSWRRLCFQTSLQHFPKEQTEKFTGQWPALISSLGVTHLIKVLNMNRKSTKQVRLPNWVKVKRWRASVWNVSNLFYHLEVYQLLYRYNVVYLLRCRIIQLIFSWSAKASLYTTITP